MGGGYVARFEETTGTGAHYVMTLDRIADGLRASVDLPETRLGTGPPVLLRFASDEIVLGPPDRWGPLADLPRIDPRTLTFR